MRTVIPDPPPPEIAELLERRHRLGLDRRDEVWEGVYHMAPAGRARHAHIGHQLAELLGPAARRVGLRPLAEFNLGEPDDFRVPDAGYHRPDPAMADAVFLPTADLVVEVLSPGDETWDKLPFYAAHGVDEILVADPDARTVTILRRVGGGYEATPGSAVLGVAGVDLAQALDWS